MTAPPRLDDVTTPALLLDGPVLMDNLERMSRRVAAAGVELWPHTKTHKSREIARLQREHGAAGLTVATVREAGCFAAAGFERRADRLSADRRTGGFDAILELDKRLDVRVKVDGIESVRRLRRRRPACRAKPPVPLGGRLGRVGRCGTVPGARHSRPDRRRRHSRSRTPPSMGS